MIRMGKLWLASACGRRGKWVAVAVWLGVVALFGVFAGSVESVQDNDETRWMPAGAGSTRAAEVARLAFPDEDTVPMIAVYSRKGGLSDRDRAVVEDDRTALERLVGDRVTGPRFSTDGESVTVTVPVAGDDVDSGEVGRIVADARAAVAESLPPGLEAKVTGPAAFRADSVEANGSADLGLSLATVAVVVVVLLLTYRSPVLPLVTLVCVVAGVVVAQGGTYLLARAGVVVSGSSYVLMVVLVFGLGTDYALLLISRYRDELSTHEDRHRAMAVAVRHTVPTVVASGATVMLAALALLTADMNSTRGIGPVAAVAVAAAVAAMTTFLPALLVLLGRWVFWPRVPGRAVGGGGPVTRGGWSAVAGTVGARPRRIWVASLLGLAVAGCGVLWLEVGSLAGAENFTREPESVAGQRMLAAHFPEGSVSTSVVYTPSGTARAAAATAGAVPGVAEVGAVQFSLSGEWARLTVVLDDPPTSAAAQETVVALRDRLAAVDGDALVGGQTAALLDQNRAMNRDLLVIVPVVVVVVALLLALLLRSLLAPLILLGCTLLSAVAALGVSTVIFHALGLPRTDQTVLTLGFLFLVALGADYTIFLMARAREEARRRGHRTGVLHALASTGGVITSAGVVLAATFLVLTITPVVLNVQLGLLVAVGVLIDALVVRALLVPALALDLGPRIWWPSRLADSARGAS